MRVFLDTNILISAILWQNGTAAKAYAKAVSHPNSGMLCKVNIDELTEVFERKFPDKIEFLNDFLDSALSVLEVVPVPKNIDALESKIRDVKDKPILRAAIDAKADIFVTGDKDFLESGITTPLIVSAGEFLALG